MPTIEESLRYYLNTTGLSLGPISQRVYLFHTTQLKTRPYLVLTNITPHPRHAHDGPTTSQERVYQFSIFDDSQSDGAALADALRRLIDGFQGVMGPVGSQLTVRSILFESQRYIYEQEERTHGFNQDYCIQWYEA